MPATRFLVLAQMGADLRRSGAIEPRTAAAMWATHLGHALLTAWSLKSRRMELPLPPRTATTVGWTITTAGTALCLLGIRRFTGTGELAGPSNRTLLTDGIYQYSRNPQYLGYLLTLTGLAVSRRSGAALTLTAVVAASYATWVPIIGEHPNHLLGDPYRRYRDRTRRWWGRRDRRGKRRPETR